MWFYKLYKPIYWHKVKKYDEIPHNLLQTKIMLPFIIYAPIYYFIDTILLIVSGLAFKNTCKLFLLLHHIASVLGLTPIIF